MSNEIEDLIANIEQKFDDEFSKQQTDASPTKADKQKDSSKQQSHNPESETNTPFNNQINKSESQRKPEIMIEEDHQTAEIGHDQSEDLNLNQNRKLDYGESEDRQEENQDDDEEEENENKYKQLSHKLETALKKISSSKKQFGTFHSAAPASDYLNRFEDYQRKKEKDLEMKRKIEQQKKYHGLKSKPDINQKSKQIAEQTSYKPIYQRFENILQDKKKKMETIQENKKIHEEEEYQKFMEEFKKHSKIEPEACRDTDTYFHDMMAWKTKLEKAREQKLKQKEQKQKQGYTFKPELNKKSVRMIKNQKRVPIQEREIQRPKVAQQEYTFQPKINKRRVP